MAKKRNKKVANAKARGRNLQQKVAKDFSKITGFKYGKDEMIASREMGSAGTDIRLIGPAKEILDVAVECKAHKPPWSPHSWIEQSISNFILEDFSDWVVIARRPGERKPVAFLSYDYFIKLSGRNSLTDHDTFILKAWRTLKWIDDNRSKSKNDEWIVVASKDTNDDRTIIIEYSYYIRLLANLVAKRQNIKAFKRK